MSGLFNSFNIARTGMYTTQTKINVASHNIANAATDGYSRQNVNVSTTIPNTLPGIGQMGTGVEIDSITRTRDIYLDNQVRYESSLSGKFESTTTVMEQVEIVFLEPSDTGLNTVMNEMWTSWQELSKTPENSNTRTLVTQNALTFTDNVNHMMDQLDTIVEDAVSLSESKAYDANSLLNQVNDLNDQIYRTKLRGLEPNDLMDQRDLLLDKLSSIIDIDTKLSQFGSVEVTSAETGVVLLSDNPQELPEGQINIIRDIQFDGSNYTFTMAKNGDVNDVSTYSTTIDMSDYAEGDVVFVDPMTWEDNPPVMVKAEITQGQLAGQMQSIDLVQKYEEQIDKLVQSLAMSINTIHRDDGADVNGGIDFFTAKDGVSSITARNITVNQAIVDDVSLVNTGALASSPEGDGSRALAIAQLRNGMYPINDIDSFQSYIDANYDPATMTIAPTTSGTAFDSYYKDIIAKVGIDAQGAQRGLENQNNLLLQLTQRRESISGVSIDEEVANLVQLQTAYQANAKVMSTITMMLDTLINGMGL
ncbi:MAG: flagellar hook-associated protein FlgK [Clostridiales bacterium]|nr:flagellar hook-associated protein FlgK [Clostridiales bacterium]